jgi:hypothetical protein
MTAKQRMSILLDRWPAACRAQGWNPQNRDLRLYVISQALGRQVRSMNELDNANDVDRVFAHLGMLADNVARTIETLPAPTVNFSAGLDSAGQPKHVRKPDTDGERRRLMWLILKHSTPLGGVSYALSLARDKFGITEGLTTLDDLDGEQLQQLMMTLNQRRRAKARKAPEPEPAMAAVNDNQPF